jgi:hypothetical protein
MSDSVPRRWLRWPLSLWLYGGLLLTAGLITLSWLAFQHSRRGAAIQSLRQLGASVGIDESHSGPLLPWGHSRWFGPALGELEIVELANPSVTDDDLQAFRAFPELLILRLDHTQVSDAGLVHLSNLRLLQWLRLEHTRISDAGLAILSKLTNLETLALRGTNVTDAGLRHLKSLTNLRNLDVGETAVSEAGIAELKASLPDLEITR